MHEKRKHAARKPETKIRAFMPGGRSRTTQLYLMALIPMLLLVVFKYLPMFGIVVAFKKFRYDTGIWGSKWVGFKNFETFFKSIDFVRVLRNTLGLNFLFIVVDTVGAVALAIALYHIRSRRKTKVYQTIMITPRFLSWVVVSYVAYALLDPSFGVLNRILISLGFEKISWYTEAKYWPAILCFFSLWKGVGMNSIIYYAALMGIDASLFEAADLDGANRWQRVRYVILPCLVPLIVIMTILHIGRIFHSDFGLFYQVTRNVGRLYSTTDVIDTYAFRMMRVIGDMGISSAISLVQSVTGLILVLITNHLSKKVDPDYGLM